MHSQSIDLPPNPKPGHCYIRCMGEEETMSRWEDVDCTILERQKFVLEMDNDVLSKKDKRKLNKILKPFIKKGLVMELTGYHKPIAGDSKNGELNKNKLIEVENYFVKRGFKANLLKAKMQSSENNTENEFTYWAVNVSLKDCE